MYGYSRRSKLSVTFTTPNGVKPRDETPFENCLYFNPRARHWRMAEVNNVSAEAITIRVKDQAGEETFFKVKNTTKMSKVFAAYAQRKGVQQTSLRFLLDGERITNDDTPKTLELEDQDQIDCLLEQYGGVSLRVSFA